MLEIHAGRKSARILYSQISRGLRSCVSKFSRPDSTQVRQLLVIHRTCNASPFPSCEFQVCRQRHCDSAMHFSNVGGNEKEAHPIPNKSCGDGKYGRKEGKKKNKVASMKYFWHTTFELRRQIKNAHNQPV